MNFFDFHEGLGIVSKPMAKAVSLVVLAAALVFAPVRTWLVNQAIQREQQAIAPFTQAYIKATNQMLENMNKPVPPK